MNIFKMDKLSQIVKDNKCDLKNILFQVLHCLYIIQNKYKTFRHNPLPLKIY